MSTIPTSTPQPPCIPASNLVMPESDARATGRRQKWLLVYPKSSTPLMVDSGKVSMPLNLMMVGTVAKDRFDIELVDERIGNKIPEDFSKWDVIALTARTLNVKNAYQIADRALAQGKKVILGGVHPTMMPEEAKQHATTVVIGEIESVWDSLSQDVQNGTLQDTYRAGSLKSMTEMKNADFDIAMRAKHSNKYSYRVPILATKGCPVGCNFCTTPTIYGKSFRVRDSQRVVDEIKYHQNRIGKKDIRVSFMDDNISFKPSFMDELLHDMVGLGAKWNANISMNFLEKPYVAELAKEAGCELLSVGFESVSPETIQLVQKGSNRTLRYDDVVGNVHKNGVAIQGYFIFGFDTDTIDSFQGTYDFIMKHRIEFPVFTLATPFPGTPWYDELKAAGRIRHFDWDKYDTFHHLYIPKKLSQEQLFENFIKVQREIYSWKSIYHRMNGRPLDWVWGLNVAMHFFTQRLKPEMFL
jgi:bacteriochlorophyll C12 methyltransferase